MKNLLESQLKEIDRLIAKKPKGTNWSEVQKLHRTRIWYLQHERLVHLIITLFFGSIFLELSLFCILFPVFPLILVLVVIFMVLTIAYIFHYYKLENGVQKLYQQDEKLNKLV